MKTNAASVLGLILLNSFLPIHAKGGENEIPTAMNSVAYSDMFSKVGPAFEKKTGIKLKYTNDPTQIYGSHLNLQDVTTGKSEMGVSAIEFADWIKVAKKELPNLDTSGLTHRVLGKSLIVVSAHPDVGVTALTDMQLGGIYSGKIKNWKEVGGKDVSITLVLQPNSKSRNGVFSKRVMNGGDFSKERVIKVSTNDEVLALLRSKPGTTGLLPEKGVDKTGIMVLKHDEIGRPFTMITKGKPSEKVFQLIKFIETDGRKILEDSAKR